MNLLQKILNGDAKDQVNVVKVTADNLKIKIGISKVLWVLGPNDSPFINRQLWTCLLLHNHYISEENNYP